MLDELRQKPKSVRNQYAFWIAFTVTVVIAALWLISLSVRFDGSPDPLTKTKENSGAFSQFYEEATKNLSEIFSSIKNPPEDVETDPSTEVASSSDAATTSAEMEPKPPGQTIQIITSSSSASTTKTE